MLQGTIMCLCHEFVRQAAVGLVLVQVDATVDRFVTPTERVMRLVIAPLLLPAMAELYLSTAAYNTSMGGAPVQAG